MNPIMPELTASCSAAFLNEFKTPRFGSLDAVQFVSLLFYCCREGNPG
jgi:hypothetical protein